MPFSFLNKQNIQIMKKIATFFYFFSLLAAFGCSKIDVVQNGGLSHPNSIMAKNINSLAITGDPFAPYLTNVPSIISNISTTNSGSGSSAITIKRFTLSSKNGINTVFAIMAFPQAAGIYPAILFNHGGGGNAETQLGNVQRLAARGYVTLAIDQPGIASVTNTPNSSGPWKSVAGGEGPRFNVSGGVQNSTLFDAGVAGLEAFNYLAAQANVDNNKMAISGTSWGGYMTTFLSGTLGTRVKAAYSVFGCGYYELGSAWSTVLASMIASDRLTWLTYLDAGRRAPYITAPYFIEEPSNDTYFWPQAVSGTLAAVPGTKNRVITPNLNHMETSTSNVMIQSYMDYYLKGIGSRFGSVSISAVVPQSDGSLQVEMNVDLPASVTASSVQLYYSIPTATWQERNWTAIGASFVSGTSYIANLPASLVNQNVNFYGYLTDSRTVVTSSAMYRSLTSLDNCDAATGWSSGNVLSLNSGDKKQGTASLQSSGQGTNDFQKVFTSYNSGANAVTGKLDFWYFVSDVTKLSSNNQIELGSGGAADINEYNWNMGTLVNGWNHIVKNFSSASITGGPPNLAAINWFRIYNVKTGTVTTKIDDLQIISVN